MAFAQIPGSMFFLGIFCIFEGQPGVGGFIFFGFFRIFGIPGFQASVAGPQDNNLLGHYSESLINRFSFG